MGKEVYWEIVLRDERWAKFVGQVVAIGRKRNWDWQFIEMYILESIHHLTLDELPKDPRKLEQDMEICWHELGNE